MNNLDMNALMKIISKMDKKRLGSWACQGTRDFESKEEWKH